MQRIIVLSALAVLTVAGVESPAAQVRGDRQGTVIFLNGKELPERVNAMFQRRARLGVTVALEPSANDSIGATISAVTPGGPAAKAGIRSGDIITKLDGTPVLTTSAEPGARGGSAEESAPGARLIELAARLEPRDTIAVEYARQGRRATTTLVTGDDPIFTLLADTFSFAWPSERRAWDGVSAFQLNPNPFVRDSTLRTMVVTRDRLARGLEGRLGRMELAPLTADLAPYFGTSEGVLILRAPDTASLGLKGGDVVLTIGGRTVASPSSFMRILTSYEPGEPIAFEIMRLKRKESITGRIER